MPPSIGISWPRSAFVEGVEPFVGLGDVRLTAIRSLFAYATLRHPEHAASIARVLAIPAKRFDKATVSFLDREVTALLRTPDRTRWEGRRDYTFMLVAIQTSLRVSELLGLDCLDVTLGVGAHLRRHGKGRKHRAVPLNEPVEQAHERRHATCCARYSQARTASDPAISRASADAGVAVPAASVWA